MIDKKRIMSSALSIIEAIGEDPKREGLLDTPLRIAEMYSELFSGMEMKPAPIILAVDDAVFRTIFATHGECLSGNIEVLVSEAGVRTVRNKHSVSVASGVDRVLNSRVLLRHPVDLPDHG